MATLSLVILVSLFSAAVGSCPNFWTAFDGSCYAFIQNPSTWAGASEICQEMKSHLVSVENSEENTFLKSYIKTKNVHADHIWMGGNDLLSENNWVWESGELLSYTDWGKQQPDNSGHQENCLDMSPAFGYVWNDNQCYQRYYFICEMDESTDPGFG